MHTLRVGLRYLNTLPKNTLHKDFKDCKDCIYYLKHVIEDESMCLKFGKKIEDTFTGNNFLYAKKCRSDTQKCGPNALHYISNLMK